MIDLMSPPSRHPALAQTPVQTRDEAKAAGLYGWNIRCQRCGKWGASWYYCRPAHPEWRDMALCAPHAKELRDEVRRHEAVIADMTRENFRQEASR